MSTPFYTDPLLHQCRFSAAFNTSDYDDCNYCTVTATANALNILWSEAQALLGRIGLEKIVLGLRGHPEAGTSWCYKSSGARKKEFDSCPEL